MSPHLADGLPPMPTTPLEEGGEDIELEKRAKGTVAAAALRMHGKRIIVTENKLVVFTTMATRAGDKIVILFGCNYPVVLRHMEPKVSGMQVDCNFYRSECMSWKLIGEIYVDAIMYGAAMRNFNAGKYMEESYYIY